MNLLDCPIRELPPTKGRFSQLKRCCTTYKLGKTITLREFLLGIKEGKYRWLGTSVYKQILLFLIDENHFTPKER